MYVAVSFDCCTGVKAEGFVPKTVTNAEGLKRYFSLFASQHFLKTLGDQRKTETGGNLASCLVYKDRAS
jgi:hypothetical protein